MTIACIFYNFSVEGLVEVYRTVKLSVTSDRLSLTIFFQEREWYPSAVESSQHGETEQ